MTLMTLERPLRATTQALATALLATAAAGALGQPGKGDWQVVVNNAHYIPQAGTCDVTAPDPAVCRTYNSYNPPSVNERGLVV